MYINYRNWRWGGTAEKITISNFRGVHSHENMLAETAEFTETAIIMQPDPHMP